MIVIAQIIWYYWWKQNAYNICIFFMIKWGGDSLIYHAEFFCKNAVPQSSEQLNKWEPRRTFSTRKIQASQQTSVTCCWLCDHHYRLPTTDGKSEFKKMIQSSISIRRFHHISETCVKLCRANKDRSHRVVKTEWGCEVCRTVTSSLSMAPSIKHLYSLDMSLLAKTAAADVLSAFWGSLRFVPAETNTKYFEQIDPFANHDGWRISLPRRPVYRFVFSHCTSSGVVKRER